MKETNEYVLKIRALKQRVDERLSSLSQEKMKFLAIKKAKEEYRNRLAIHLKKLYQSSKQSEKLVGIDFKSELEEVVVMIMALDGEIDELHGLIQQIEIQRSEILKEFSYNLAVIDAQTKCDERKSSAVLKYQRALTRAETRYQRETNRATKKSR